uniref:uncharacterized protein LOC122580095 isoform X2 n=1 Tax=Erigeron canadensis TaxID=72917 RepID=UPI001CB930C9|nr:uncharacterized protein LOC122580095 isoform X2 [Erigeron canadensis]
MDGHDESGSNDTMQNALFSASETTKLLSLSKDLISNQPSPFANLKKLKIVPVSGMPLPTEVDNYLLGGSSTSRCNLY